MRFGVAARLRVISGCGHRLKHRSPRLCARTPPCRLQPQNTCRHSLMALSLQDLQQEMWLPNGLRSCDPQEIDKSISGHSATRGRESNRRTRWSNADSSSG